jgi:hypothetical protein
MANDAKGKRKVYFTVGGRGLKPDLDVRNVSGGMFNKKIRKHKAVRNSQFINTVEKQDIVPMKSFKESMIK